MLGHEVSKVLGSIDPLDGNFTSDLLLLEPQHVHVDVTYPVEARSLDDTFSPLKRPNTLELCNRPQALREA